jgi:tape measure domain-containing protein
MQNAAREMKKAGDQLKNVGQSMTMNLTAPIVALGAAALYSFGQIDSLKRGLISFSGSAQLAEEEFTKLREVAKLPGIGLEEAVRGSINLQAIGMNADDARKAMMAFGNAIATVGGGKENFDLAIRGFSQLTNASKPLQQDLYQIANQLPQVNKLMIEAFGTNRAEDLAKMGISGKQLADFLVTELEKLPKISGGIKNSFENMSDSVKISLASFGESIEKNFNISGKINALSDAISNIANGFANLQPWVQKLILGVGLFLAALGPLLLIIGAIIQIMPTFLAGWAALKAAFLVMTTLSAPLILEFGLMVAAIASIAAIGMYVYANWSVIKTHLVNLFSGLADSILTNVKAITDALDWLFSKFGVNTFGNASKWFDDLIQSLPDKKDAGNFMTFGESLTKTMSDIKGALFVNDTKTASTSKTAKKDNPIVKGLTISDEDAKKAWEQNTKAQNEIALRLTQNDSIARSLRDKHKEQAEVVGTGWDNTNTQFKKGVEGFTSQMAIAKGKIMQGLEQLTSEINNMLKVALVDGIVDTFSQIGENLAMNEDPFKDVGKNLLNSLGKLMSLIGSALVAFGVNLALAETGIITLNPVQAIAAGAAMVAAGAFISATAKKGLKGGSSESPSYQGGSSSSQGNDLVLTTRLDGRDLLLSGQSTSYVKRR